MIRPILTALLLAASASLACAATDEELKAEIVGAWGQDAACTSGTLTFNGDGTFSLARDDRAETGTWQITGGVLSGATADGSSRPDVKVRIEGDSLHLDGTDETPGETLTRCAS